MEATLAQYFVVFAIVTASSFALSGWLPRQGFPLSFMCCVQMLEPLGLTNIMYIVLESICFVLVIQCDLAHLFDLSLGKLDAFAVSVSLKDLDIGWVGWL